MAKETENKSKSPRATKYRGTVAANFKYDGKEYKSGDNFSTTNKTLFDKLISIYKIVKK